MSYWNRLVMSKISRRRALAASGAGALGAAFLAACGGGGNNKVEDVNTLVTKPADTSKQAKKGGTLNHYRNAGTDNMDPYASLSNITSSISGMVYSRLTMLEAGYQEESGGNIVGDLAESWEWSPDRLTLTMKMRQGVKFHNSAPVNGRVIDMEDVTLSWQRFAQRGLLRSELVNSVNPNAPVTSLTTPDSRTVVFKLNAPVAHLTTLLATPNSGNPHIAPKEADTGFDMRQRMIGSGPWQFESYEPSVGWKFKRNPEYFLDKGERPFIENVNIPIIPEYSSGLAQFKAGNLHYFAVLPQDILTMKNEEPRISVYQTLYNATPFRTIFGWNPTANRTPFRDERVRQAYSMTLDRDLITDVIYNVDQFRKSGLPVETRWNGEVLANWYAGWWLDPKSKDFGPNAKYLQRDVAEAKKLMAAAGLADGVEVLNTYWTTGEGGPDFPKNVEILCDMAREAGFRFQTNILPFAGEYASRYRDSKGRFEGISYKFGPSGGGQDAIGQLTYFNHSTGGGYGGFDPRGAGDFSGDPFLDSELNKAKGEVDVAKRKAIAYEIQRYLAKAAYQPRWPASATGFEMAWPALRNYRVWDRDPRPNYHFWLDDTQPPERK